MAFNESLVVLLPLRALQFIFAIIVIGLSAYGINEGNFYQYPNFGSVGADPINYSLFTGLWAIVSLLYLILANVRLQASPFGHPYVLFIVDGLATILWLAQWISMAQRLGMSGCEADGTSICAVSKALAVIGAFSFGLFFITWLLSIVGIVNRLKAKKSGKGTATV